MYNKTMVVPSAFKNSIQEISVLLSDGDDEVLKKFHCLVCGKTVFEYYNYAKIVIAGKHLHKSPKVVQCNNMVTFDTATQQAVNVDMAEFGCNRERYFKSKCKTKYWIS